MHDDVILLLTLLAESLRSFLDEKETVRRVFTATTRILLVFPFMFLFGNPSEVSITKALICTRKQSPEGFLS